MIRYILNEELKNGQNPYLSGQNALSENFTLSKFQKLFVVYTLFIIGLYVFRSNFLIGSVFYFFQWLWLLISVVFSFLILKKNHPLIFKVIGVGILACMLLDIGVSQLLRYSAIMPEEGKEIKLMTYNLLFSNKNHSKSLNKIKNANPDILLLQEFTYGWQSDIDSAFGEKYTYKYLIPDNGTSGLAIYSTYPLSNKKIFYDGSRFPVGLLAHVKIGEKKILLANAHFFSPAPAFENPKKFYRLYSKNYHQRVGQYNNLNKLITKEAKGTSAQIFAGDLNTMHSEPLYHDILKDWEDQFRETGTGLGKTFPRNRFIPAFVTLDYIFTKGRAKSTRYKIVEGGSSDHLAQFAKIIL